MRAFLRPWTTGWRRSPITSCSVTTWLCRRTDQQDQGAQAPLLWHLQPGPSLPASVSGSGRLSHVCAQRGLIPLYMESSTGSIREPVFLCDLFPPEADPEFHGGEVPPREQIKEVRDGTIHILVTRGTEEACHQLFRLVEFFPQQPGLRWGYRRALQEKRQK